MTATSMIIVSTLCFLFIAAFNHTAPCVVKRAGIVDDIRAGREQSGDQKRIWRDPERRAERCEKKATTKRTRGEAAGLSSLV